MEKKASHWRQWNEVEVVRRYGGEGGIRTPGRSFPLRRFSKPLLSTTQPPLREMHMVLKGILPHRRAGIEKGEGASVIVSVIARIARAQIDRTAGTRLQLRCWHCAPVAQLDRAFASGAKQ